ncbi:hypothetical protein BT69DRAFT_1283341 [Atractiella rhizophila]|nr:hypothetical protein BT69DRAFT_1283341 [Atractiella rhizophila]
MLLNLHLDPPCKDPACIPDCRCKNRRPNIHVLTSLYLEQVRQSAENEDASFAATYAGLLLGIAIADRPAVQEIVMRDLNEDEEVIKALEQSMKELEAKRKEGETEDLDTENPVGIKIP